MDNAKLGAKLGANFAQQGWLETLLLMVSKVADIEATYVRCYRQI